MKIQEIIDKLCSHEISKNDAVYLLSEMFNTVRLRTSIECDVTSVACTVENNHGIINLKIPYGYSKIENKLSKGDKVDLIIIP